MQDCRFRGLVRIGRLAAGDVVERGELVLPVGLRDSTIVSCDLGDGVAIDRVGLIAHTIVGDGCVLLNVGSVSTSRHAVFGHGWVRGGDRAVIQVGNEAGGRAILPFAGMRPADAWVWSRHREDTVLMQRFVELTDALDDRNEGHYSRIGASCVVRETRVLRDVRLGHYATVAGAGRIENVTLASCARQPTQVTDALLIEDGIADEGCRLGAGVQARRFVLGERVTLESGVRLSHTVVGDNSTIACCEVLHNLIFPLHEQHHNNSFLIATTLMGQSNIAAGATIGSNHNSRAPDGEILAGRGFWPGLCASFKHNCRFASHVLVAKGSYPAELNVPMPFSLLSLGDGEDGLMLMPAWMLMHNMYAVQRNQWKFRDRDRRVHRRQHIVTEAFAPDTAEEILHALALLEEWVGTKLGGAEPERRRGRRLLQEQPAEADRLDLRVKGIENSRRLTRLLKPGTAYVVYREMLFHYCVMELVEAAERAELASPVELLQLWGDVAPATRETRWENWGGQLIPGAEADRLREAIRSGGPASWADVHAQYDRLWQAYPEARARHAAAVALELESLPSLADVPWREWAERALATQRRIAALVRESRAKDFTQPFRAITFASRAEMDVVLGRLEDNRFVRQVAEEAEAVAQRLRPLLG